jgi:hypothetical protein
MVGGIAVTRSFRIRSDDYQAIVSMPSAMGSGTYSLTLQWNQITWGVGLAVCALLGITSLAAGMLARGGTAPSSKPPVLLYSRLSIAECLRRLDSAAEKNIGYYHRTSLENRVTFELERRRGRFSRSLLAPYFYGVLQGEGDSTGTTIVGRFGFAPRARRGNWPRCLSGPQFGHLRLLRRIVQR